MSFLKTTKNIVGGAVTLGIGNAVLGEIPGSSGVVGGLGKASNMMGMYSNVALASESMNLFNGFGKKKQKKW